MTVAAMDLSTNISTENTNNGTFKNPLHDVNMMIVFITVYVFVFVCCFFGNAIILIVIIKNKRMRTRTNFFLANLAVADFCVGIFCVIPNLTIRINSTWKLGRVMCKLYNFIESMSYTASILLLAVIAIERYVAIMYPLRSRQLFTSVRLQVAQVCIWLVASGYNAHLLFIYDIFKGSNSTEFCYFTTSVDNIRAMVTVNFVFLYVFPLCVLTIVYTRISLTLWSTSKSNLMKTKDNNVKVTLRKTEDKKCTCVCPNDSNSSDMDEKEVTRVTVNTAVTENSSSSETRQEKCLKSNLRNGTLKNTIGDGRRSPSKVTYCLPNDHCNKANNHSNHCSQGAKYSLSPWQIRRSNNSRSPKATKRMEHGKVEVCPDLVSEVTFSEDTDSVRSRVSVRRSRNTKVSSRNALSSRRRVIKLLMAVLISFAICVLPHHLKNLLHFWNIYFGFSYLPPIVYIMLYLNSALNPILYWLFSDSFRRSFRDTFLCCRKGPRAGRYTVT